MATSDPKQWESDPEYIELMDFLIERTKDVKKPLKLRTLAVEYRQKKRSSQEVAYFSRRIDILRGKISKAKSIDIVTRMKIMFALGSFLHKNLMKELQKYAYVEVDEYRRITKYRAHDGSLNLEGQHKKSSEARNMARKSDDVMIPESTKRAAPEVSANSAKRFRDNREPVDYIPSENHPLSESMEILNHPGVQIPQEPYREPPNSKIQELIEPKRERESLGLPGAPEVLLFETEVVPRVPEPPVSSRSYISQGAPRSEADKAQTPQIKFLEAIQSLVLFLGIPPSEIPEKIQQKTQKIDRITTIHNNEVALALKLLVVRIVNHSVANLSENVKSISLKEFLCYLKAAILNSKLEGLENLLKKIEKNIREPESKDKNIPVEKVKKALQDTLNNVGF